MATQAKGRKERVIDPKKIKDSYQWLDAYTNNYKNVIMGPAGELLVQNTDRSVIEKTISHDLGNDSAVVLASSELRTPVYTAALANQEAIQKGIADNTKTALDAFLKAERNLLDAVNEWKRESDKAIRRNLSFKIGELTIELKALDETLSRAMYPYRYVKSVEIEKKMINYASRDDRNIVIDTIVLKRTNPDMRNFTVKDMV